MFICLSLHHARNFCKCVCLLHLVSTQIKDASKFKLKQKDLTEYFSKLVFQRAAYANKNFISQSLKINKDYQYNISF